MLRIRHTLAMAIRETAARETRPTAAVIDSQSVKTTEAGKPRRYRVGEKFIKRSDIAKDFDATISSASVWLLVAHIRLLTRQSARARCGMTSSESNFEFFGEDAYVHPVPMSLNIGVDHLGA